MTVQARLTIQFTGYWISGTGAGRGRDVDVVTHRDDDGLPAMPLSQIKGQLRETAERLAEAGAGPWDAARVLRIFGARPDLAPDAAPDSDAGTAVDPSGAVAFRGKARLPATTRSWLASPAAAPERKRLFRRLASTAIGPLGAAKDHSLRAVEAVVPVTLEAKLEWIGPAKPDPDWIAALDMVCAATVAFGKLKADGYGRAIAELT